MKIRHPRTHVGNLSVLLSKPMPSTQVGATAQSIEDTTLRYAGSKKCAVINF